MKWHRYAAVMKELLTPTVPVQAHESCLLFSEVIGTATFMALFTYLMILWEASVTLRRGLIKIECHLVLITVVRGMMWLVSLFRNRSGNTTYVYV